MISTFIWVTFQKEGIHCYPDAARLPSLADVSFLASPHRHIFHFKVTAEVNHDNRDIEFIQLKRKCESWLKDGTMQLDYKSCEMMAREMIDLLQDEYGRSRSYAVEVSEDGENGATLLSEAEYDFSDDE